MAKVFISYSRKDIEFAKRLTVELQKSDVDSWIDWEGIPPTVDWWKEIEKGIEESDAFLFLISPDSISSKVCQQEMDHAVRNGKRIIPLVIREINSSEAPSLLNRLNWIFFCRNDGFEVSLAKLLMSIHTDYDWLQVHRRLQVKALEWEKNNREDGFLLRGADLQTAELQLTTNLEKEPHPTDLQHQYVSESLRALEAQRRLTRRNLIVVSIVGVALLLGVALAQMGYFSRLMYQPVDMQDYWVAIPAGEFQMGSDQSFDAEMPVHTVYLETFEIGRYEVTNRQYDQCVKAGSCRAVPDPGEGKELHPVVNTTWHDAKAFCEWVGGRLPTEAEWEKAASWDDQAKTVRPYPWGETIDCTYANYAGIDGGNDFCVGDTMPAVSYENGKNSYGLYNMAGNVWEWVNDWYSDTYYQTSPSSNPLGPDTGQYRSRRGGSWKDDEEAARSTYRDWDFPGSFDDSFGFRCSRDPVP